VIDLHSHILPGVDDGAADADASLELARAAVADGIEVLAATPHVRRDYPTPVETMERLVRELRTALRAEEIPLELLPGGELALDALGRLDDDELRRFGLGGNEGYLLIEFPYVGFPLQLRDIVFGLRMRGFRPVLAHPERNGEVQASPERLEPLVEGGALVQVTAASVDGRLGRASKTAAARLLELGLAHLLASDAHAPTLREIGMSSAAAELGDEELAHWLTVEVPGAIVRGQPVPERPERPTRRVRLRWRR